MATKIVKLSGEISYANNLTFADMKYPSPEGAGIFKANVKLDEPSLKVFEQSGLRLRPKDGVFGFKRPEFKMLKGEKVDFGMPKITGADPNTIGNGSTVTVTVSVYDTRIGKGHRLEAVHVDNLIEYKKPEEAAPKEALPF